MSYTGYLTRGKATLEDLVESSVGSVAIIDGPIRADATPPAGYQPTPTRTFFVLCWLFFGDVVDGGLAQQMQYRDHALPGPLLVEWSGGGVTNVAYRRRPACRLPGST